MVAARTSQADTVQYKNNEQYSTQKTKATQSSNSVAEQITLNTQHRKQSKSDKIFTV
jgi:hypothetical protein